MSKFSKGLGQKNTLYVSILYLRYGKSLHRSGHRGLLPALDAVPDQESRNGEPANNDDHPDQLTQLLTLAANMLETMDGRSLEKLPEEPPHRAHDGWPVECKVD